MLLRLLIPGLLLLAGCAETSPPPVVEPDSPSSIPAASAVTLEIQTSDETSKLIASHKGRIVVVDLWTLW